MSLSFYEMKQTLNYCVKLLNKFLTTLNFVLFFFLFFMAILLDQ
jgi:hypothetical protein